MLEVQLAMLGLLILSNVILLIETICLQMLLSYKSYYSIIPNLNYNYDLNYSYNNYEKNNSHTNDYNQIMFYT